MIHDSKPVTHEDLGISEDEFNNFLIDLWSGVNKKSETEPRKYVYAFCNPDTGEMETGESDVPIVANIKINSSNYPK